MSSFTIEMNSPFPPGALTGTNGGPRTGDHQPPDWYNEFGMDLSGRVGTEVRAAFDGYVTRYHPHVPATDTSRVYGAQIFMRCRASPTGTAFSDDKMGGFYQHITGVPSTLAQGTYVAKGTLLGTLFYPVATHLHFALVEIIGGAPGGVYNGVNIFSQVMEMTRENKTMIVTFNQSASTPPTVTFR